MAAVQIIYIFGGHIIRKKKRAVVGILICTVMIIASILIYNNYYKIPQFDGSFIEIYNNFDEEKTHVLAVRVMGNIGGYDEIGKPEPGDTVYIVGTVYDVEPDPSGKLEYLLTNSKVCYFLESKRDFSKSMTEQYGVINAGWTDDNKVMIDDILLNPLKESYDYRRK